MLLATIQPAGPRPDRLGWVATDVIKVSEIVTGSGVSLATKYLAFVRCGGLDLDCLADRQSLVARDKVLGHNAISAGNWVRNFTGR
jgi:hypothetical protein